MSIVIFVKTLQLYHDQTTCDFRTLSSNLSLISPPQRVCISPLTKAHMEFMMILFPFLEEHDNDVNFLSSSPTLSVPFPQQSIWSATNCGLNLRTFVLSLLLEGWRDWSERIIISLISCHLERSRNGVFNAWEVWEGSLHSVKLESLARVNTLCLLQKCHGWL